MPPAELSEIISKLPLRVGLYVPEDILDEWFSGQTGSSVLDQAREYAESLECEFKHYPERAEGVFWKWVPAL